MDKKSKILIIIFLFLVIVSVSVTFFRYIILENINFYTDKDAFDEALSEQ